MKIRLFIVAVASIAIAVVMAILLGMPEAQAQTICGPVQAAVIPGDVVHLKIEYCYSGDFHNFENSGLLPPHDGHSEGNSSSDRCWQYYVAATAPDYNTNWHIDLTGGSFSGWNCDMQITGVDVMTAGRRYSIPRTTKDNKNVYANISAVTAGASAALALAVGKLPNPVPIGVSYALGGVSYISAQLTVHFKTLDPFDDGYAERYEATVDPQIGADLDNFGCPDDFNDGWLPWFCRDLAETGKQMLAATKAIEVSVDRMNSCDQVGAGCGDDRSQDVHAYMKQAGWWFAYYADHLGWLADKIEQTGTNTVDADNQYDAIGLLNWAHDWMHSASDDYQQ